MEVKVVLCEILLPLLLLYLHAWRFVDGVQFEVSSRTTKCVAEEIQSDVLVVGDYKIVSSSEENLRITIKVCVTHTISDSLSLSLMILLSLLFLGNGCDRCGHGHRTWCKFLLLT
jgi:hypothetical protein